MARVDTAGPEGYVALRQRVQSLKQQHVEAVQQQHVQREAELSSIASRCSHLEAVNSALTGENERLQQQLRQNTERSAKLRRQHEREEQKLREQVEKLSTTLASSNMEWASKLAASETAGTERVQQLEAELRRLKEEQDAEVLRLKQDHSERLQDVDEWCRGEIEAVQHNVRSQVAQAHEAVQQWQQKYDGMADAYIKLKDTNQALQAELDEVRTTLQLREHELHEANNALVRLHKARAEDQAAAEEEKQGLRKQHAEQMEAKSAQHAEQLARIEERLQAVVAKKDATILALRAELKNTYSTLLPLKSM